MWRGLALGVAIGVLVAVFGMAWQPSATVYGDRIIDQMSSDSILVRNWSTTNDGQMIAIVDPLTRVMGTYRVDPQSGVIELRSVREFGWDLRMQEFNGGEPSPRQVQAMIERP